MSRWLLALLFAFGSVTFLTGCPEEGGDAPDAEDVEDTAEDVEDEAEDVVDEGEDVVDDVTE